MPFERFTKIRTKFFDPRATICKNGVLYINGPFAEQTQPHKYCVSYFSKEDKAIGLRFTSDTNEEGLLKATKRTTAHGSFICLRSFLAYHNITFDHSIKLHPVYNAKEDMWIMKLER